ncbi:unnamed protein product [Cylicostephanus goldi]|uniref:Uncharacterized protein n=1 Tax=Cylicostephanus goldi TaxID=71465 RepID=A0A3P6RD57_CYLGO|nr:unnamed protein product [Cylicostephanus goldi]
MLTFDVILWKHLARNRKEKNPIVWFMRRLLKCRNNTKTETVDVNGTLHSVYVILLDSTAHTQGIRNLPQTMHFFENSMQAVTFPHINKVGLNSRPNGVALWFGKRLEAVNRKLFGLPDIPPDWTHEHYCKTFLDNETSLFKEYSDRGYKTLLAEDWMKGTLNWPNCWGFNKQPTDHYMR